MLYEMDMFHLSPILCLSGVLPERHLFVLLLTPEILLSVECPTPQKTAYVFERHQSDDMIISRGCFGVRVEQVGYCERL